MSYTFTVTSPGKALFISLLWMGVLLLGYSSHSFGAERNIQFTLDAETGQWKAACLKNLPQKTTLRISASGRETFTVLVVDEKSYLLLPKVKSPLFQDRINKDLTFSFTIPHTDNYYLVLDNRQGTKEVSVHFAIKASYDGPAVNSAAVLPKNAPASFGNQLNDIPKELKKLFIFTPFAIDARSCGTANITTTSKDITLCLEFIQKLTAQFKEKEKVQDILLFALLHEVGHILLHQWNSPFSGNEEIADEFATILLLMMNKPESVSTTAEYFLSNPTADELTAKTLKDDRHPLSIQRARNILHCIKDKEKYRRWIQFFIPHIQTPVLEKLLASSQTNLDKESIRQELKRRNASGNR
jgi:hypothetical protein